MKKVFLHFFFSFPVEKQKRCCFRMDPQDMLFDMES